jgi:peptide subunit release factor 1 (eRF1)
LSAKIDLNIPRDIKNERVVSNLVQEIRTASQIKDNEKLLCIILGICRIVNELQDMRKDTRGLRIIVDAVQGGSALEVKEYNGTDYSCRIE